MTASVSTAQSWPRLAPVQQSFGGQPVTDLTGAVARCLQVLEAAERVQPGQRVAVTAGSRGIVDIVPTTAAAVAALRALGAEPFVFPCMGSHGGSTPAGQQAVLDSYGFTPAALGCPVICQGEVVQLGQTVGGIPLFCDSVAAAADWLLVINRVKPHTDFRGRIESGPTKMLAIGLGKHHSAGACHQRVAERGYVPVLREVGDALWARLPLLGGIGLIENGHDRTVGIEPIRPASHEDDEAALLERAREVFGHLPFDDLDVLVLDEIGKDISGAGLDPNVTGYDPCKTHDRRDSPRIWRICLRDLTPASHGNATGIGLADFVLRRLVDQVDWGFVAANVVTGVAPESGRCPLVYPDDRTMLEAAFRTTRACPPAAQRLVRARSTLHIDRLLVAESLLPEVAQHPRCEQVGEPEPLCFDAAGMLLPDRVGEVLPSSQGDD